MWMHTHIICIFYPPPLFNANAPLPLMHSHLPVQTHSHTHAHMYKHSKSSDAAVGAHKHSINSRDSVRGVGGVWEGHMQFTRHWWKHVLAHLITVLSHQKKKKEKKNIFTRLFLRGFVSSYSHTHKHTRRQSCAGFWWCTPTGILILLHNHLWTKKMADISQLVRADTLPSSGCGDNCLGSLNI